MPCWWRVSRNRRDTMVGAVAVAGAPGQRESSWLPPPPSTCTGLRLAGAELVDSDSTASAMRSRCSRTGQRRSRGHGRPCTESEEAKLHTDHDWTGNADALPMPTTPTSQLLLVTSSHRSHGSASSGARVDVTNISGFDCTSVNDICNHMMAATLTMRARTIIASTIGAATVMPASAG